MYWKKTHVRWNEQLSKQPQNLLKGNHYQRCKAEFHQVYRLHSPSPATKLSRTTTACFRRQEKPAFLTACVQLLRVTFTVSSSSQSKKNLQFHDDELSVTVTVCHSEQQTSKKRWHFMKAEFNHVRNCNPSSCARRIHYHVHHTSPLDPTLSQLNSVPCSQNPLLDPTLCQQNSLPCSEEAVRHWNIR